MSSDVVAALAPIAGALKWMGVRYYVGGSLASSVRGLPRTSIDVDLSAELGPEARSPRSYLTRWAPELGVSDLLDQALAAAEAAG